jgi:hypothetical protein
MATSFLDSTTALTISVESIVDAQFVIYSYDQTSVDALYLTKHSDVPWITGIHLITGDHDAIDASFRLSVAQPEFHDVSIFVNANNIQYVDGTTYIDVPYDEHDDYGIFIDTHFFGYLDSTAFFIGLEEGGADAPTYTGVVDEPYISTIHVITGYSEYTDATSNIHIDKPYIDSTFYYVVPIDEWLDSTSFVRIQETSYVDGDFLTYVPDSTDWSFYCRIFGILYEDNDYEIALAEYLDSTSYVIIEDIEWELYPYYIGVTSDWSYWGFHLGYQWWYYKDNITYIDVEEEFGFEDNHYIIPIKYYNYYDWDTEAYVIDPYINWDIVFALNEYRAIVDYDFYLNFVDSYKDYSFIFSSDIHWYTDKDYTITIGSPYIDYYGIVFANDVDPNSYYDVSFRFAQVEIYVDYQFIAALYYNFNDTWTYVEVTSNFIDWEFMLPVGAWYYKDYNFEMYHDEPYKDYNFYTQFGFMYEDWSFQMRHDVPYEDWNIWFWNELVPHYLDTTAEIYIEDWWEDWDYIVRIWAPGIGGPDSPSHGGRFAPRDDEGAYGQRRRQIGSEPPIPGDEGEDGWEGPPTIMVETLILWCVKRTIRHILQMLINNYILQYDIQKKDKFLNRSDTVYNFIQRIRQMDRVWELIKKGYYNIARSKMYRPAVSAQSRMIDWEIQNRHNREMFEPGSENITEMGQDIIESAGYDLYEGGEQPEGPITTGALRLMEFSSLGIDGVDMNGAPGLSDARITTEYVETVRRELRNMSDMADDDDIYMAAVYAFREIDEFVAWCKDANMPFDSFALGYFTGAKTEIYTTIEDGYIDQYESRIAEEIGWLLDEEE